LHVLLAKVLLVYSSIRNSGLSFAGTFDRMLAGAPHTPGKIMLQIH
jgi:hypothetical protein